MFRHPRGPRSGPGSVVPIHHHLIDLIRPARRHIATSPHRRLICDAFAVRERLGDPRAVPGFRWPPFFPDMPPCDHGEFDIDQFQAATSTLAFAKGAAARHSQSSRNPFPAGGNFRGFHGSHICYGLSVCSAPCTDLTGLPANGAFYIQAFNGSVALLVVGYDYSIDWTPMLVGLSPTRLAASLAARSSPSRCGPGRNIATGQTWDLPTSDAFLLRVTCS
jgi:hypothetical protein